MWTRFWWMFIIWKANRNRSTQNLTHWRGNDLRCIYGNLPSLLTPALCTPLKVILLIYHSVSIVLTQMCIIIIQLPQLTTIQDRHSVTCWDWFHFMLFLSIKSPNFPSQVWILHQQIWTFYSVPLAFYK